MSQRCWMVTFVLGWACPALSQGGPPALPDSVHLTSLVKQLGSPHFREREAASRALDTIGAPVLPLLDVAAHNRDPEIARRAEWLKQQIEKREQTGHLLEAKRVHLVCNNTPVTEAVAELARLSDFPIRLIDPKLQRDNPKITLDTGLTTFWQAFDHLCHKAGLMESVNVTHNDQAMRAWNGPGVAMAALPMHARLTNGGGHLNLVGGKPHDLSTCYVGAVRIRAIPSPRNAWGRDKAQVILEVTPQPGMAWRVFEVRIDRAVDEHGHALANAAAPVLNNQVEAATGNNLIIWDEAVGKPVRGEVPIRLAMGAEPSRMVREIAGSLGAEVETPLEPLVMVDDVLHSAGRTVQGTHGEVLKVIEIKRESPEPARIAVQIVEPARSGLAFAGNMGAMVMRNRPGRRAAFMRGAVTRSVANDVAVTLFDGKGHPLQERNSSMRASSIGNTVTRELSMSFDQAEGQGKGVKLIYSGKRVVNIEVPFTLSNVPLQ